MSEPKHQWPEWAAGFVRGALQIGMPVPEIEQHLVSRGLSAAEASSIVMEIVEGNVRQRTAPLAALAIGKPIRLLLSAAIGGACFFLAYRYGGSLSVGRSIIFLAPALLSIWLPELTDMQDSDWGMTWLFCGWVLLFLYFGYRIFLWVVVAGAP